MGEYFKSSRRKLGVVTLLMALVLSAGWLRSQLYYDRISVPISPGTFRSFDVATIRGRILWSGDIKLTKPYYQAQEFDPDMFRFVEKYVYPTRKSWKYNAFWKWLGYKNDEYDRLWVIPHCFIVLPLTALSAFLLLIKKPNTSTQTKTAYPITGEEGAAS